MKRFILLFIVIWLSQSAIKAQSYSLNFDGANNFLMVTIPSIQFVDFRSFTIEAWINLHPSSEPIQKLVCWNSVTGNMEIFSVNLHKNSLGYYFNSSIYLNGNEYHTSNSPIIPHSTWIHIAISWDSKNGLANYVNGEIAGHAKTNGNLMEAPSLIRFGTDKNGLRNFFSGQIDEIKIWGISKSAYDIYNQICKPLSGMEIGLLAWFSMNEGNGSTLIDQSQNASHGRLQNTNEMDWYNDYAIPKGEGTYQKPFEINSFHHLIWMSEYSHCWNKHFIQTADIDLKISEYLNNGQGFSPIGCNSLQKFSGIYNGNNHIISNLYINRPDADYVGLFGVAGHESNTVSVYRLKLENANVIGGKYTGSLIGLLNGGVTTSVENCEASGKVICLESSGGLIGNINPASLTENKSSCQKPKISQCRNEVEVKSFEKYSEMIEFVEYGNYNLNQSNSIIAISGQRIDNQNINLSWFLENSSSNYKFIIQKSTDGISFTQIGMVENPTNSTSPLRFEFTDRDASSSIVYYRIRQIDKAGRFVNSNIINIHRNADNKDVVIIYPNPFSNLLNISFGNPNDKVQLTVYDSDGKIMFENPAFDQKMIAMETSKWSSGAYVCLIVGKSYMLHFKIIKS